MSVIRKALRVVSLPTIIGSAGMAAITLYKGEGFTAALFVFVAWYLFIQLIIWVASKVRGFFTRWREVSR